MQEATFSQLIQAAYDAAGSRLRWQAFAKKYASAFGADGMWLGHQTSSRIDCIECSVGFDPSWLHQYQAHYSSQNPFSAPLVKSTVGRILHTDSLVPRKVAERSVFGAEWVKPQGFQLPATAAVLMRNHQATSLIALQWRADRPESAIEASIAPQQRFVSHLQGALRLHRRVLELEELNVSLLRALELSQLPVLVCDSHGKVLVANSPAEAIVADNDGLTWSADQLACISPCANRRLRHCIQAAARASARDANEPPPDVVFVPRVGKRADYEILVCPVPARCASESHPRACALVFVTDPERQPKTSEQVLRKLYRLTAQEARILMRLAAGDSPAGIADTLRVSRETLKSHLKSLFHKTNTHRQGQLIAKVLMGLGQLREDAYATEQRRSLTV